MGRHMTFVTSHISRTHFTAPDTRCLEKREILTVSEFDVVARFPETIPAVKSILLSEI